MNPLRIYTALRDKDFEDNVIKLIADNGHEAHSVSIDSILNDLRT